MHLVYRRDVLHLPNGWVPEKSEAFPNYSAILYTYSLAILDSKIDSNVAWSILVCLIPCIIPEPGTINCEQFSEYQLDHARGVEKLFNMERIGNEI